MAELKKSELQAALTAAEVELQELQAVNAELISDLETVGLDCDRAEAERDNAQEVAAGLRVDLAAYETLARESITVLDDQRQAVDSLASQLRFLAQTLLAVAAYQGADPEVVNTIVHAAVADVYPEDFAD